MACRPEAPLYCPCGPVLYCLSSIAAGGALGMLPGGVGTNQLGWDCCPVPFRIPSEDLGGGRTTFPVSTRRSLGVAAPPPPSAESRRSTEPPPSNRFPPPPPPRPALRGRPSSQQAPSSPSWSSSSRAAAVAAAADGPSSSSEGCGDRSPNDECVAGGVCLASPPPGRYPLVGFGGGV